MAVAIRSFEDLEVWQVSQDWAVDVYQITKSFPDEERYGLVPQMRRSVASISANIAEGFGRRTFNDKKHFYTMAYGSALETKNFIYLAKKLAYIDNNEAIKLLDKGTSVQKLINAFTGGLK